MINYILKLNITDMENPRNTTMINYMNQNLELNITDIENLGGIIP